MNAAPYLCPWGCVLDALATVGNKQPKTPLIRCYVLLLLLLPFRCVWCYSTLNLHDSPP